MEYGIALIIGLALIIGALFFYRKIKTIEKNGIVTDGIVFDLTDSQSFSLRYKIPIVRFLDNQQQWITETSNIGLPIGTFKPGDKITITYDKKNPKNFMINTSLNKLVISSLFISGCALTLLSIYLLFNI